MSLGVKGDLKQEIFNEVNENVRALERLFPSAVKDGQVDFEALKEELGQFEEVGPEKYGLTWSGKQNAKKIAQEDIVGKTLKYIPEDSKNPETTENLYIEGDNLEVLKLLRQNYYGAIKMIYIDPPYNTGNDFVYKDNFNMHKEESDKAEGEISELGERYTINSKSSNKYHANWLNMMYPRLKVAKDLLTEDGVIFISIDDNEGSNLKGICDEIFSEDNFVATIVWEKNFAPKNDHKYISESHEYCLMYAKNKMKYNRILLPRTDENNKGYSNPDNDTRGIWTSGTMLATTYNSKYVFGVEKPNGEIAYPPEGRCWRYSSEKIKELVRDNRIWFGKDGGNVPRVKRFLSEVADGIVPMTLWKHTEVSNNQNATNSLKKLFDGKQIFSFSKPIEYIRKMMIICTDKNDIILDFFSGSSTTANSIMQLNSEDLGNRKFIMVQYPEKIDKKSEAAEFGYKNICEIGKERIRRAGEKIKDENKDKEGIEDLDIGFKVFRVGDTNIRWNYEKENLKTLSNEVTIRSSEEQTTFDFIAATTHQDNLDETVSAKDRLDFMPGAKDIDIVYEILLRQRDIPLSAKVELLEDIGKRTYIFADSYLVCLEEDITVELIEKLAELNPLPIKFILRDSAFGDDIALKDEAYRRLKALIERNSGESKKTYTVEFI